jgi:DNA adenine methylase
VANYVEPFFGSGAVLLNRPTSPGIETVNDLDCMVANFWRALQHEPEAVTEAADNPVNEADQHARISALLSGRIRERMKVDPEYYDEMRDWWVWGQCIWIGSGWCSVQPHVRARVRAYIAGYTHPSGTGVRAYIISDLTSGTPVRARIRASPAERGYGTH